MGIHFFLAIFFLSIYRKRRNDLYLAGGLKGRVMGKGQRSTCCLSQISSYDLPGANGEKKTPGVVR